MDLLVCEAKQSQNIDIFGQIFCAHHFERRRSPNIYIQALFGVANGDSRRWQGKMRLPCKRGQCCEQSGRDSNQAKPRQCQTNIVSLPSIPNHDAHININGMVPMCVLKCSMANSILLRADRILIITVFIPKIKQKTFRNIRGL